MFERRVKVASPVGLHARPAALFVQAVAATGLPVSLTRADGRTADARSILAVVTLDVRHGEEVVISVDDGAHGEGAEQALDRLVELLSHG